MWYIKLLISSVIVFSFWACGGGGDTIINVSSPEGLQAYANRPDMPNTTTANDSVAVPQVSKNIVQRVQSLGYQNPKNLYKIDDSKVAFTYSQNGDEKFCVYDWNAGQAISLINNFHGGNIVQINGNNIYFSNNVFVNIENPWYAQVQSYSQRPQVQTSYHDSGSSVEDRLRSRYGSRLVSATYTYAKGGIFVEVRDGNQIALHLLDSGSLNDEKVLKRYSNPMRKIIGLQGGLVRLVYSGGREEVYDYLNGHEVSTQGSTQTNSNVSNETLVKNAVNAYYARAHGIYQFESIRYLSASKYVVRCLVEGEMDTHEALVLVDVSNRNNVRAVQIEIVNWEAGAHVDIVSIDTNRGILDCQSWMDEQYVYFSYNYINEYKISKRDVEDSTNNYQNNTSSTQSNTSTNNNNSSSVASQISNKLENLVAWSYSKQGGGIFAIGTKNGAYSFYRFDASSLKLERSFYNVGLNRNYTIQGIDALSNGNFRIYTSGGTYTFDYFKGSFN